MKTLMKDLGNMNPGELEPKPYKGGDVDVVSPIMDSLPEGTSMEFRNAVFEAIVDEVIDDTIAEKESESEAPVTDGDVEEVVEPIVDKAVALYLVSRDEYRKVANMIHSKIVERKTRSSLLAKVAHFVAEAVTETDYNAGADNIDNPIDETVDIGGEIKDATSEKDESPADGTSPTTAKWQKIWASGNRRSRFEADDEYSAGADGIDNPINETVKIDGEIKDATSEKDESPADGTSPTTAKWENIWKAGKGRPRFEAETEGETADESSSEEASDAETYGVPENETATGETADTEGEVADATSEEDETAAEGTAPTTAKWANIWKAAATPIDAVKAKAKQGAKPKPQKPGQNCEEGAEGCTEGNDIKVAVDNGFDANEKANLRYLVKSAIHHRRATALVSKTMTAEAADKMLHDLRYVLPAKFYDKYSR